MAEDQVRVNQDSMRAAGEGQWIDAKGTKRGELCVIDFFTEMALEGRCYHVRAGTISAPVSADIEITDAGAEMCVDAPSNVTVMPVEAMFSISAHVKNEIAIAGKSVATASTSGTAYIPLPILIGGAPCRSSARVQSAGNVAVTVETPATTVRHFHVESEFSPTDGGDPHLSLNPVIWQPIGPPVLNGIRCFYIQAASKTTGFTYFGHFDFLELETVNVS